ncbi:MAG: hypothetical protein M9926_11950 [Lentimicrobium sp.]|jgi:hypothetical protein|uniref:hypothetical protein n=1 Tax=Lentimicrobium sp. TaxID=2034841 RepID=UPI0025F9847B|nr:hypothetical protein [Lentimicrobium sp.]MCO5257457.1 hypothetical protein [Lentimicrobium sp.]MCO5262586.1 hypothetical protein [Lentimicrobium sp.]HPQ88448.1 hypothetical protein [Gammaproteobacteria bacterium]HRW69501.1 hypothetical protein [Lentimicrobium sp.]
MKTITRLPGLLTFCTALNEHAQIIYMNPDPNEDAWIAGPMPEITSESQARLNATPEL